MRTKPRRLLDRYYVFDEIASGGMATVYFGRVVGMGGFSRTVAIKTLHPHLAKEPDFVAMFLDEARLAARIQHPNVAATLDVLHHAGEIFVVMEYIHGESLAGLLREAWRDGGKVPTNIACATISSLLHGLHAAHEVKDPSGLPLRLVHRDVSPQNVIVGIDGIVRVLDFGIAKAAGRLQTTHGAAVKGKYSYMAPEQVLSEPVDRRTDVFAAGIMLWELCAGRRLFDGDDIAATAHAIVHDTVPSPREVNPDVPVELETIVLRALARRAANRWPTARAMALELERATPSAKAGEVGEWVERLAARTLARRAKLASEMEQAALPSGADVETTAPPDDTLVPAPEDLPADSRSQISSVSVSSALRRYEGADRQRRAAYGIAAIALLVGGGLWAASRRTTEPANTPAGSIEAPPPSAAAAPPPPPTATAAAEAPTAPLVVAVQPTSNVVAPAPSRPRALPPPKAPVSASAAPDKPAPTAAPAGSAPAPDCRNRFRIDENGNRIPRPECFK